MIDFFDLIKRLFSHSDRLRILIEPTENGFKATCLEWDLVAEEPTIDQVKASILDLIRAHADFAKSHDWEKSIWHPAPTEEWQKFFSFRHHEASRKIEPEIVCASC